MPRFQDTHITILKKTLLAREPECMLTAEDVESIQEKTGLSVAQIRVWADNFRFRVPVNERVACLSQDKAADQVEISHQFTRCYFSCFNVDPEFASVFKFPKSKGGGFFTIKYLDAGFNKEAEMGEFFIEFFEKVKEHKLAQALERAGAGQVTITTFANNDGNESASNALLRVWTVQKQTGYSYRSGDCQEALLTKTQARFAESQKKQQETSEFDEKTVAAIKQSLAELGETNKQSLAEIGAVSGKVDYVGTKVNNIQQGVCEIISELKAKIEFQDRVIQEVKLSRDQQEAKTAQATKRINVEIEKVDKLSMEIIELKTKLWSKVKEIEHLREIANMTDAIKQAHSLHFHLKRFSERLDEDECKKCAKYN